MPSKEPVRFCPIKNTQPFRTQPRLQAPALTDATIHIKSHIACSNSTDLQLADKGSSVATATAAPHKRTNKEKRNASCRIENLRT